MGYFCNVCERVTTDKNLFCTRMDCPPKAEPIWGAGQLIGDTKITRLLNITKTAVYYEALRGEETVILKASVNKLCHERLRAEAQLLAEIARLRDRRMRPSFFARVLQIHRLRHYPDPYPGIPKLLSAYQSASREAFPFGAAVINGQEVYFWVAEHINGVSLREYLTKTPQPWFINAVWVIMRLGRILHMLHQEVPMVHLALNPDAVWVLEDTHGRLRPMLMDYGFVVKPGGKIDLSGLYRFTDNTYIPPELIFQEDKLDQRAVAAHPSYDVYQLGLLLHEMLAGKPRFLRERLPDTIIRHNVAANITNGVKSLNRNDIESLSQYRSLGGITQTMIAHDRQQRANINAAQMVDNLRNIVGEIPREPVPRSLGRVLAWIVAIGLLLLMLTLLMAVAIAIA